LQDARTEIDLSKETAKAIWEKLKPCLPTYALFKSDRPSTDQDEEAQDPMKAAIREALASQEEVLNGIAEQVKTEVQDIANKTVAKIQEMDPELASQLNPVITNKKWDSVFSVRLTGDEDIPVNKRGSGIRRLILLNFFRAKAEHVSSERDTGIIYAVEEPETSQHPKNQMMLTDAFSELVNNNDVQVLLTTHTPVLARRFGSKNLRLVAKNTESVDVHVCDDENIMRKVAKTLGVLPDHDVKIFVGVEGKHDINFLRTISKMLCAEGEPVPDLESAERMGHLVFVPLGGSCLELWISRLRHFDRPEFYLMDRDVPPPEIAPYQQVADQLNQRDNVTAWITGRRELENYIHTDLLVGTYATYRGDGDAFEDVPLLFAQAVHAASDTGTEWDDLDEHKKSKKISKAKKRLNTEFVSQMTPELLTEIDPTGDVRSWLGQIGNVLHA